MIRAPRCAAALALAIVGMTIGARSAVAHDGSHAYESVVEGITPPRLATGIDVRMIDDDEQLEVTNRSGETVTVRGYWDEPYARIESAGPVFINVLSPSMALSHDRLGRTPPNGDEDAAAAPRWVRVGDGGRHRWFDRRTHYREAGTPPAVADRGKRTKLWDYRVPITVGREEAVITGSLFWVGTGSVPTVPLVILLLATAGCLLLGAHVLKGFRKGEDDADG